MRAPMDVIPMWGIVVVTILLTVLALEIGFRFGLRRNKDSDVENAGHVGAAVAASLGLLAFFVAFTFGLAASRYETRRTVLLDEVNAIGTAHLRAGLLAEPQRTTARRLLREYVEVRLAAVEKGTIEAGIHQSEALQRLLWSEATAAAALDTHSIITGLFIESVNDVIDLHTTRLNAAVRSRIPVTIWIALYSVLVVTLLAMGYHGGLVRTRRSLASVSIVLSFAITLWLIADLDRPNQGLIRVSQQPMIDLKASMEQPGP